MKILANNKQRLVLASISGSVVEWYDFALIGAFAPIIAQVFFPSDDQLTALLKAFSVFATGFLARPIGSLVLGKIGDVIGRKQALLISLSIVSVSTFLLALVPDYKSAGMISTFLVVVMRLLQGFGAGGEHAGGILLLYESSKEKEKISRASTSVFGVMCGVFLGFFISTVLFKIYEYQSIIDGAWRIPFLVGGALGLVGFYIRKHVFEEEKIEYAHEVKNKATTEKSTIASLLYGIGIYCHSVVIFYAGYFFIPSYLMSREPENSLLIEVVRMGAMIFFLTIFLFVKKSADKIGAIIMLKYSSITAALLGYPILLYATQGSLVHLAIALLLITILNVVYLVPVASILAGLFTARKRYRGVGIVINLTSCFIGGTTPLIMTWLIQRTDSVDAAGVYMALVALLSFVTIIKLDKYKRLSG